VNARLGRYTSVAAAALAVCFAAATVSLSWRMEANDAQAIASQARTIAQITAEIKQLKARGAAPGDWPAIAAAVEPSVLTISTHSGLGSGWVVRSDQAGSDLVTNFHVVEEAVSAGIVTVDVQQFDRTLKGTIVRVDRNDDLALVHVSASFTPLEVAASRPPLGTAVMAVGSPLGLGGTVSVGVVSGFRSLGGSDYVQFSAPISPGNSGGPLVDGEGHVVAIATAKYIGDGVEALAFAIPVQTACLMLVSCGHPGGLGAPKPT
jgi:putative serine protease PepD